MKIQEIIKILKSLRNEKNIEGMARFGINPEGTLGISVTDLRKIAKEIGKLVDQKNAAYGSSFAESHKILSVLYPNGIKPEQYTDALAIVRVIDKLFRIANKKDAFGESPWRDIAGYAILGVSNSEKEQKD